MLNSRLGRVPYTATGGRAFAPTVNLSPASGGLISRVGRGYLGGGQLQGLPLALGSRSLMSGGLGFSPYRRSTLTNAINGALGGMNLLNPFATQQTYMGQIGAHHCGVCQQPTLAQEVVQVSQGCICLNCSSFFESYLYDHNMFG